MKSETVKDTILQEMELRYESIKMQGSSAVADWDRFWEGYPTAANMLGQIASRAQTQAQKIGLDYARKEAASTLSLQPLILQMGLEDAQMTSLRYANPDDARHAFERTFDSNENILRRAEQRLIHPLGSASVDLGKDAQSMRGYAVLGWMAIWGAAAGDPAGYGKGFFNKTTPDKPQVSTDTVVEVPLGIGAVEYDITDGEVKLQIGEGVILAGTWSPTGGFGVEFGAGIDLAEQGVGFMQATFIKVDSDGSVSVVSKTAGGDVVLQQIKVTTPIRAASNEPIGSLAGGKGSE